MEHQRFEELTRRLAAARSRRDVVKAVLGTLAGGALAARRDGVLAQAPCTSDADCAEGDICCAGSCRELECCIDDEDPNARCPEGTACFEGYCDPITQGGQTPPVQPPNTGAGSASRGPSRIMSASLASGATALGLRARRIGQGEAEERR